jgi:hypothetical protein
MRKHASRIHNVLWLGIVVLAILAAGPSAATAQESRPSFDDFKHLFRREAGGGATWNWPALETFRERFDRYAADARPVRVFEAQATFRVGDKDLSGPIHGTAVRAEGGLRIQLAGSHSRPSDLESAIRGIEWTLAGDELKPEVSITANGRTLRLSSLRMPKTGSPSPDLWADWVYVAVLLESDPDAPSDPVIQRGSCSHDTGPIRQAARHAQSAQEQGRLGRYLRLSLQIATDEFERVAQSSTGRAEHGTDARRFAVAPIDVDRFFVGLVLDLDSARRRDGWIYETRLGRAISEAGRTAVMAPKLRRLAQDPDLDDWNRFRAAAVLLYALAHDPSREPLHYGTSLTRPFEEVGATFKTLQLPAISRRWLDLP